MKSQNLKIPDKDWLMALYSETWKQYAHEDQVAQTRGTIFTAILTSILAVLGVLSSSVIQAPCIDFNGYKIYFGLNLLGILWILVIWFLRSLTNSFEKVTLAGRGYVNARGATLRIIESVAGLGLIGPALFEDDWRDKSNKLKNDPKIQVYTNIPNTEKYANIPRYNFAGGFVFFSEVIKILRRVYLVIQIAGIVLIIIGSIGTLVNLHTYIKLICP
jgi:hypothetical protein